MNEDRLIGWLCMWSLEGNCAMPTDVRKALHERGWIHVVDAELVGDEPEAEWNAYITDKGFDIIDLEGPSWGIDTLSQRARSE